jgi:hydroxypyruvate reductase
LAAALELQGAIGITLLAAGTDGCDGPTDAAGAFADGASVARAAALGTDAAGRLRENDAYRFFAAIDGLLRTGPTGTNVMDLVLIRCDAVAPS